MKRLLLLSILSIYLLPAIGQEVDVKRGEQLFKANCSACHKPDTRLIGPPLKGIAQKYENDFDYITNFVHNSQALIASGDQRAVAVFEEYGEQVMTSFPTITKEEVQSILAFADSFVVEANPDQVALRPISPKAQLPFKPLYLKTNLGSWAFYIVGVILLISVLYLMTVLADFKTNSDENS